MDMYHTHNGQNTEVKILYKRYWYSWILQCSGSSQAVVYKTAKNQDYF